MLLMANTVDFLEWLKIEMSKQGWEENEYAKLANAASINRQVVWGWFNRGKEPSTESLLKLAKVFKVDEDRVFRLAGIMSPSKAKTIDDDIQKTINEMEDMNPQDREEVVTYIRMLKNLRKKK